MNVCVLCLYVLLFCVGRGLCNRLFTRPEESYCMSFYVIKKPQRRRPRLNLGCRAVGWMDGPSILCSLTEDKVDDSVRIL
jgi:hypothetical protein